MFLISIIVQEDWMGTRNDQSESMLIKSMSLLKPGRHKMSWAPELQEVSL